MRILTLVLPREPHPLLVLGDGLVDSAERPIVSEPRDPPALVRQRLRRTEVIDVMIADGAPRPATCLCNPHLLLRREIA